jgi:peptidoglycan pentaglycine glycine transferase (the first glycine)
MGDQSTVAYVDYKVTWSCETEEPDWDVFLAETPGGHHLQTSLWAQVKATSGWHASRIIVTREEQIVAGAQLLTKPLRLFGTIGYLPKGPLFNSNDPELRNLILNELQQLIRKCRIVYLIIQPPHGGETFSYRLSCSGFRLSRNSVAPTATVLVSLTMHLDTLLAQMKPKTRYNIRVGHRKGMRVREGTVDDLHTFHNLLVITGHRNNFTPEPLEYFRTLWRIFHLHGNIKLFLAEYRCEAVSALLAIPFGNAVVYKRGAWSGNHGNYHPNEVMHWAVIKWAKSQRYSYYDLEGIDPTVAKALVNGEPYPNIHTQDLTFFKIGFGGNVTLLPNAYDYIPNPIYRLAYISVFSKIVNSPVGSKAYRYIRHLLKR